MIRKTTTVLIFVCLALPTFAAETGWQYLFNGENLDGWKVVGEQDWSVQDGNIVVKSVSRETGWLVTEEEYSDFVLRFRFRWMGGDSGIQFRSRFENEEMNGYQANLDADREFATGSLLELNGRQVLQESKHAAPMLVEKGKWTEYEISAIGNHIELRVNGLKTVDMKDEKGPKSGFIALQMLSDPGATIEWSNIRILEIPEGAHWKSLFNGRDLSGWREVGDATWDAVGDAILGRSKGGGYGWLLSEEKYKNFHFSTRFRMPKGNSGIQFRSWQVDDMIHGFQADLASDSDWISGHLYDQSERGVLVKPERDFSKVINWQGWNTYEITAFGPKVELFINGIKSIEYSDPSRVKAGVFAFQIHSGQVMETGWKDIRIVSFD